MTNSPRYSLRIPKKDKQRYQRKAAKDKKSLAGLIKWLLDGYCGK